MLWTVFLVFLAIMIAPMVIIPMIMDRKLSVGYTILYALAAVLLSVLGSYFSLPAFTGPFNGMLYFAFPVFFAGLGAVAIGFSRYTADSQDNATGHITVAASSGVALLVAIVVALVVQIGGTWGDGNAHDWANIPHVQVVSTSLPSTDVHHIVLVTHDVAKNTAQQSIGSNGQNLGSQFQVSDCDEQAIQKHIYWVCPLVYQNFLAQYENVFTLTQKPLPGFIVVDAENPQSQPMFKLGYHIMYSPNASFEHDVIRHIYEAGYTNGNLKDATLELDDNWQPYYTVSYTTPTKAFGGDVISRVLVVNAQTGQIASYTPAQTPEWVDRIVPQDFAKEWAANYGKYHNLAWWNPSGYGTMKAAGDPEMVYNSADHPVWLIPMTSNNDSDTSSTGFLEISTRYNAQNLPDSKLYKLAGYATGDTVASSFKHNPANLRNYDVSTPVLYSVEGNPTWVVTFTSSTGNGDLYQSVGLLDATPGHVNGSNVVMRQTLEQALTDYPAQLVLEGAGYTATSQGTPTKTYTGVITRINQNTVAGKTTYYVMISGYSQIFTATVDISAQIVVAQSGDSVTFSYTDTGQKVVPLRSFSDQTIGA